MRPSRREFVKWLSAGGISVSLSHLALAKEPAFGSRETLPGRGHFNPAAKGAGRVDGVAKVTGAKLYASDFRAADLPGWPATTSHAILVRANDATHVYAGMDLARLDGPAKPSMIVTAADLDRIGTRVPEFYTGDLFCPVGKTPLYLGQPVALLIFEQFDAYDRARLALRDVGFVKFGDETGPVILPDYGAYRFTRVAGATSDAPDVYSPIQAGWVSPSRIQNAALPVWLPLAKETKADYAKAATHGEQIRAQLAKDDPSQLVLDREFETQSVDPMFLEPESGLAWYSDNNGQLELVLGVQSPYEATESIAFMLGKARAPLRPAHINAQFAHVGGGFGGRDHTPFVLYVALAAMFFPGRPVRLAHDRYQQFQGGIKRHPIKMRSRIGIDRKSGKITAFAADHVLDGGGLANFSANVATVAATAAIGIYDIPKVDVTTVAVHSRGVTAGSMRGYGTLQTMTALEVLIDEAASELKVDPIAFRRNNALKQNGRTMTGNPYIVSVRTPEILDKLEKHPVWQQRADFKQKAPEGRLVGTGLACVTKDYGAGADCSLGRVEIDQEGRIAIHCDHVEMGNGIGTALANRVAGHLGTVADEVAVSRVDSYDALGLVTSGDPYTMDQKTQDLAEKNPCWVPAISSATSASIGAHVGTHSAAEAARVIFRFGLWPAALELWHIAKADPRARQWDRARWQDGQLVLDDLAPLPLSKLAATAHARGFVTGAIAHSFSRWAWSRARFPLFGEQVRAEIDALAIRRGSGKFERIDRVSVKFPPTDNNRIGTAYTSMCGTLVRVEIERATGILRIAKAYSVFECGQALVPEVVLGQSHGGFAMGVGYALLETLPPFEGGPGNGQWNLGQYLIARGSDLPLHDLEIEMLPQLTPDEPPKGMAEVVMIPIVPALLNAINDATGHRFRSLPVTSSLLKGALA
ncbi:molybdopterin-dependent oxidoreductase [Bradyrhizobium viridifuturi]|uniref:xanthine dehydrogenase family protein molybdopterin-binding subunit n=3 Tax=Nitrobacteraceae TaxID=41294 RepID=UPI00055540DD|nr:MULTISPECIES: molybdopterin cofactor-binding domain-containing protein [Bradyrhizobium]OYU59877.1 MAG: xanthine dehydrogenase [Bradyrhizobium sp. PARBB1]PSO28784.1 xanthine dehydrogenase family protein molybdopterin-binding subunit [Bradyrhizobium sp. MOS004]QRI73332.1 molybdopterin-dependent oxidoreductase [Bradyrhizobium sp. PSBB068]MBR1021148.1 molybdopterin-dependent oxidoreductase [Bradyrhizobium viridifuturi]MBR1035615.1 molybdopterin-dependent oxidoreductase [Bradyrhizobium viridifut